MGSFAGGEAAEEDERGGKVTHFFLGGAGGSAPSRSSFSFIACMAKSRNGAPSSVLRTFIRCNSCISSSYTSMVNRFRRAMSLYIYHKYSIGYPLSIGRLLTNGGIGGIQ